MRFLYGGGRRRWRGSREKASQSYKDMFIWLCIRRWRVRYGLFGRWAAGLVRERRAGLGARIRAMTADQRMSEGQFGVSEITISFEVFPPKSADAELRLLDCVDQLAALRPGYISVTYGAGGSARERSLGVIDKLAGRSSVDVAGHITCAGADRGYVDDVLRSYWASGVKRIVALRGDSTDGIGEPYTPHENGYAYASDLIAGARAIADFDISVGCYPERHPQARDLDHELEVLKRKFDAGADRAITQFFFEPETYLRYVDAARRAGIRKPIVPGIMLQSNFNGLARMAKLCGTNMPERVVKLYEGLDDDAPIRDMVTAHLVADMCDRLRDEGVRDFHFYTMNRANLPLAVCRLLDFGSSRKAV